MLPPFLVVERQPAYPHPMLKDILTIITQAIAVARQLVLDCMGQTRHAEVGTIRYKVVVDDNFKYMDEGARWEKGTYPTLEEALTVCRRLVENWLQEGYSPGISAQALYDGYVMYGDDPFIVVVDGTDESAKFSAWDYAKERSRQICGDN
jgi:hypothetical protein